MFLKSAYFLGLLTLHLVVVGRCDVTASGVADTVPESERMDPPTGLKYGRPRPSAFKTSDGKKEETTKASADKGKYEETTTKASADKGKDEHDHGKKEETTTKASADKGKDEHDHDHGKKEETTTKASADKGKKEETTKASADKGKDEHEHEHEHEHDPKKDCESDTKKVTEEVWEKKDNGFGTKKTDPCVKKHQLFMPQKDDVKSALDCGAKCEKSDMCGYATYYQSKSKKICFLHENKPGNAIHAPGNIAAISVVFKNGIMFVDKAKRTKDSKECQKQCQEEAKCNTWSHFYSGKNKGVCVLNLGKAKGSKKMNGVLSGKKYC